MLPDQAGRALYESGAEGVLDPGSGLLVLGVWVMACAALAAWSLLCRDA